MDALRDTYDWWNACGRASEIWWTRAAGSRAVADAVERRTQDLIELARARSPYYREAWSGLAPGPLALQDLPVVTKPDLMLRFDDWCTDRSVDLPGVEQFLEDKAHVGEPYLDRFIVWTSSGTTGEPGIFVQDRRAFAIYDALLAVQLQSVQIASRYAWGVASQGGRAALIAATADHFASIASWQRVRRGSPWANERAFSVTAPLPELVSALNDYQPAFLASYPTMLALLAVEQRQGRLKIAPSCVWSGGEFLSSTTRLTIERAFNAILVNEYGASECLSMAFSCPHDALHVNADWVVLEPVDRDYRATQPGERSHTVLLTNLANRIQPIIRYDLGDSITQSAGGCACGSPLPAIRVEGRQDDVLSMRADDGSVVRLSPLALTTVVESAVRGRFQLVQSAPDLIEVRLAADERGERHVEWKAVRRALLGYLDQQSLGNVRVHLAAQAPVPNSRGGKFRAVIAAVRAAAAEAGDK